MFICDVYQAYLDDEDDEAPFPCETCAAWVEKTDECLYETEEEEKERGLNGELND